MSEIPKDLYKAAEAFLDLCQNYSIPPSEVFDEFEGDGYDFN